MPTTFMKLKKQQRLHHSVALYRWQITMRLATEIAALKKKRRITNASAYSLGN